MSTGAVVLAILTVIGAFGAAWLGAYVAAQRADARWQQEFQHAQGRWQHDSQVNEARYWRDRRSKVYAELLSVWRDLDDQFGSYAVVREATKVDPEQLDDARDSLLVVGKRYRDLAAEVAVEASQPVMDLTAAGTLQVSQFLGLIMEDYNLAENGPRASKEELDVVVVRLKTGLAQFELQVRTELGVPPG